MPKYMNGYYFSDFVTTKSGLKLDRDLVTDAEIAVLRSQDPLVHFDKQIVRSMVRKVFFAAVRHLGEEETLCFWPQVAKKERGGAKYGSRKPDKDRKLLAFYDTERRKSPAREIPKLPRTIGERLHKIAPGKYGHSADAITRQIRRLLDKRRQYAMAPGRLPFGITPAPSAGGGIASGGRGISSPNMSRKGGITSAFPTGD